MSKAQTTPNRKSPSRKSPSRGASGHRITRMDRLGRWFARHRYEAGDALIRLIQMPASALMTLSMLAVALAVPGFLLTLLINFEQLTPTTELKPQLAVYLKSGTDTKRVDQISRELLLRDDLLSVEMISPDTGAADFKARSELGELLELFDTNPLPAVILLVPRDEDADALQAMQQSLFSIEEVDTVELDIEWLVRLAAILNSFERISMILSLLLGLTVLLVVANTIRTMIGNRLEEIEVSLLMGATSPWVRRPFLYAGLWYGLFGALLSIVLIYSALILVESPLRQMTELYLGAFELQGLGFQGVVSLLALGSVLGWGGAYLAVSRQLTQFEPQ